jgi:hypothetical protein
VEGLRTVADIVVTVMRFTAGADIG